jgi:hypothetical protein
MVIVAILHRGTSKELDLLFNALLPNFHELAFNEPHWKVAVEMMCIGTVRQKLQMAVSVQERLVGAASCGPFVEIVVVQLMWALPAQARRVFVENNREALAALNTSRIKAALAEMEAVDTCV